MIIANKNIECHYTKDENNKNHTIKDDPNDTIGEGRMYEQFGNPMCPLASFGSMVSEEKTL
jgi:hypothetical protein